MNDFDRPVQFSDGFLYAYLRGTVDDVLARRVPRGTLKRAQARLRWFERARAVSDVVRQAERAERAR